MDQMKAIWLPEQEQQQSLDSLRLKQRWSLAVHLWHWQIFDLGAFHPKGLIKNTWHTSIPPKKIFASQLCHNMLVYYVDTFFDIMIRNQYINTHTHTSRCCQHHELVAVTPCNLGMPPCSRAARQRLTTFAKWGPAGDAGDAGDSTTSLSAGFGSSPNRRIRTAVLERYYLPSVNGAK